MRSAANHGTQTGHVQKIRAPQDITGSGQSSSAGLELYYLLQVGARRETSYLSQGLTVSQVVGADPEALEV